MQAAQLLLSGKAGAGSQGHSQCCENGRPIMTDPCTGQTICTCQLGAGIAYLPKIPGLPENMFGPGAYPPANMLGAEPSAFYPLANGHVLGVDRATAEAWKTMSPQPSPPGCYQFDPMMAAHPYGAFYGGLDLNNAARRKNATRETTSALKAWLYEHRKNPYPTKGEKIMLAIITKMTLTQVSTWFANARRRLKKESKLGFSSKDNDDDDDDDCDKGDSDADVKTKYRHNSEVTESESANDMDDDLDDINVSSDVSDISDIEDDDNAIIKTEHEHVKNNRLQDPHIESTHGRVSSPGVSTSSSNEASPKQSVDVRAPITNNSPTPAQPTRPKIWSITEIMSSSGPSTKRSSNVSSTVSNTHISRNSILQYDSALIANGRPTVPVSALNGSDSCASALALSKASSTPQLNVPRASPHCSPLSPAFYRHSVLYQSPTLPHTSPISPIDISSTPLDCRAGRLNSAIPAGE